MKIFLLLIIILFVPSFTFTQNYVSVSTDSAMYLPGSSITVTLTYWNTTDTSTLLPFTSGCRWNYSVDSICFFPCDGPCTDTFGMQIIPPHSNKQWGNVMPTNFPFGTHTIVGWLGSNNPLHNNLGEGRTTFLMDSVHTVSFNVVKGWNMMSIPIHFHGVVNGGMPWNPYNPFCYCGGYGYHQIDTLNDGTGYWLKFQNAQTLSFSGHLLLSDTITVNTGWNMAGSISVPISVSNITTPTPGLTVSPFFGYDESARYTKADTIYPGKAYWMKANKPGKIILSAFPSDFVTSKIKIISNGEVPPPPPNSSAANVVPKDFMLNQNYPNPFNPATIINYQLPSEAFVRLSIYNVLGQEVRTLVNKPEVAGYKSVQFDASNFSSGIYIYRLTAGTFTDVKKMLLIR
ncbi:MAG: T9SS type A sorting domain-containing protein [Bacteroidota bacterium]